MIYQELSLARPISIAENILIGRLPRKKNLRIDRKAMIEETPGRSGSDRTGPGSHDPCERSLPA